jgi:hypothetical protein
MLSWIKAL